MASVLTRKGDAEKRVWKLEMAAAKSFKELEDLVEVYNGALTDLTLHATIARALGENNCTLRVDSNNADKPLTIDIKSQVKYASMACKICNYDTCIYKLYFFFVGAAVAATGQ